MILADTSVWVDHLRNGNAKLRGLLESREVLIHPFVVGELSLGHLQPRQVILDDLRSLPQTEVASHDEILDFISEYRLFGYGIGYVDAHLLAGTRLTAGATLWTRDKQLHRVAHRLTIAANVAS